MKYLFYIVAGTMILSGYLHPQSNVSPDISLIGTFNTSSDFYSASPYNKKIHFEYPAMEMLIESYLNPFARAQAIISWEDKEFSMEELYAEVVRGLPLDLQIKAGKFLLPFGKINLQHPHAWPFLERPLFHQMYFGPDGFNDIGINLSLLLPTGDIYTNLDLGIYKGDAIGKSETAAPYDENSISLHRGNTPVFSGRIGSFFPLGDYSDLEAGISASYGIHAAAEGIIPANLLPVPADNLKYTYLGFDFKYKYKPDSYTSLIIQGEGILNHRDVFRVFELPDKSLTYRTKSINTAGAFLFFDYHFNKQFSTGIKYDFTYGIIGDAPSMYSLSNDDINKTYGISAWFGYYPVEETLALRLGLQHLTFSLSDGESKEDETSIKLQLIFSLGPHKAHTF